MFVTAQCPEMSIVIIDPVIHCAIHMAQKYHEHPSFLVPLKVYTSKSGL